MTAGLYDQVPVAAEPLPTPAAIMTIGAHPDDAEFGAGGTIYNWTQTGAHATFVIATDGSMGSWDPHLDRDDLVAQRRSEQMAAAAILGVASVAWLGQPDGELRNTPGVRKAIATLIRRHRPDIVLTHDPWQRYQLHPDHRATGFLAIDAVVAAREPRFLPDQPLEAHRPTAVLLWSADEPDHVESVGESAFEAKIEALLCHSSQSKTTMAGAADSSDALEGFVGTIDGWLREQVNRSAPAGPRRSSDSRRRGEEGDNLMEALVLGAGIVGSAAVWDLVRRGHTVTVADADRDTAVEVARRLDARPAHLDVSDRDGLNALLKDSDAVVSAVPYRFGVIVAEAAIRAGAHYADFGGNPTVVAAQMELNDAAVSADVLVVPDCGLAPGLANVLADLLIDTTPGRARSVQMRVGALPQEPQGALGYQLAFSPAGLINEYAEPCEILEDGHYRTVDPLTRFETVAWDGWGPLEAFSTAGGTSTMCLHRHGTVDNLEYKTLRFPGHGRIFAAMREMGLFSEADDASPRAVLLAALDRTLPRNAPDLVLVRVWIETDRTRRVLEVEDVFDGRFSALARTTAFPATALIDLVLRNEITLRGVHSMQRAVDGALMIDELESVGIDVVERSD